MQTTTVTKNSAQRDGGRFKERPISVDAESLMNAQAALLDVISALPDGPWRLRFSQILQSIRDSISHYERSSRSVA